MRSTVIQPKKNIFERFGGYLFEKDYESSISVLGVLGTIISVIGILVSISSNDVSFEVIYFSTVFGVASLSIMIWAIFGFKLANGIIKYATADEVSFSNSKWNPNNYKWNGGEVYVTVVPIAALVAVVPIATYHFWYIMAPVLAVVGIGWGLVYTSRKAFMIKKRFTQHVSDPNAHKSEHTTNENEFDKAA